VVNAIVAGAAAPSRVLPAPEQWALNRGESLVPLRGGAGLPVGARHRLGRGLAVIVGATGVPSPRSLAGLDRSDALTR
jgi:hypothetical protein